MTLKNYNKSIILAYLFAYQLYYLVVRNPHYKFNQTELFNFINQCKSSDVDYLTKSGLSRFITELSKIGFIVFEDSPLDKRNKFIQITMAGINALVPIDFSMILYHKISHFMNRDTIQQKLRSNEPFDSPGSIEIEILFKQYFS